MNVSYFPTMALPLLVARLRNNDYDATAFDLNIDFLQKIYTESYLKMSLSRAEIIYKKLDKEKDLFYKKQNTYKDDLLTRKYDLIHDF